MKPQRSSAGDFRRLAAGVIRLFRTINRAEAVRRYISAASLAILQRLVELVKMATIATQKRMNLEMNALQLKSDWHTRQVDIHETHLIP